MKIPENLLGFQTNDIIGVLTVNGWQCMLCDPDANFFTFLIALYRHLYQHHNITLEEYKQEDNFIIKNRKGPF